MNRRKLFALFLVGIMFSLVEATPLYVLAVAEGADPTCVQPVFTVNTVPFTIPAGAVQGDILPASGTGSTANWKISAGINWVRSGRCCDPDGDPIGTIELVSGTCPATVAYNATTGLWTLMVNSVPVGIHAFVVKITDAPDPTQATPAFRIVTVLVKAERANAKPVAF